MNLAILRTGVWGLCLSLLLAGCSSGRPITVYPVLDAKLAEGAVCPRTEAVYFVAPVTDKRGIADARWVGKTQAGTLASATDLLSDPSPAELLQEALKAWLLRCHNLTGEQDHAAKQLRPTLLRFEVAETGTFPSAQMRAVLLYEIEVVRPDWVVEHRAVVTAEASVGVGIGAANPAAEVMRTTIDESLSDLSLKLPRY